MLADVHFSELTPPEQRVLGCLIEKRWTTPDQYPLSLNALRLACNQSTNRDPVTRYDESTVRDAAQRLCKYGLARLASGHGSRATKYRHLAEEALGLGREELAVLAVLLLRGPQTPGELKGRTERMAALGSLAEVERVLAVLAERDFARRLERRPGQKEDRFEHLLGGGEQESGPALESPQHHRPARPGRTTWSSASSPSRPRWRRCARSWQRCAKSATSAARPKRDTARHVPERPPGRRHGRTRAGSPRRREQSRLELRAVPGAARRRDRRGP
jgi:uncharacterized protein YceH (UPF0502 family)